VIRPPHLHDERLFDCYVAGRFGEAVDPRAAEHLSECAECADRFDALTQFMDHVRTEGDAQADALFTAERLWDQHQTVLQRIDHIAHPARVISFPGRVGRQVVGATTRVTPRWLAAAAAAGLFIGVAVGGMFFDTGSRVIGTTSMSARSTPAAAPAPAAAASETTPAVVIETVDDDQFLVELEHALQNPRIRELMPLDALTPHVQDISTRLR
jgi:hypothetical protein